MEDYLLEMSAAILRGRWVDDLERSLRHTMATEMEYARPLKLPNGWWIAIER